MADAKESPDNSDFELEVESDDDMPLAKKKQKGTRYDSNSTKLDRYVMPDTCTQIDS